MKTQLILVQICIYLNLGAQNIITTIAGGGTDRWTNGIPALSAGFNGLTDVHVDAAGNIYTVDASDHRIRRIDTSGIINTIAGTGTFGYNGDGISATSAQIYQSQQVDVDAAGNIYIADYFNYRVRKVNTSGIISTIAGNGTEGFAGDGGPAISAEIWAPQGVAVDSRGNVYIGCGSGRVVRKVDTNGIITRFAGTAVSGNTGDGGPAVNAQLTIADQMTVDASYNVYIVDPGTINANIRKVDTAGIITTIAGTGTPGFSGDGGPATAAQLNSPSDIAIDPAGNIYIADFSNFRIRKINPSGIISTVAGTGIQGYSGDGGDPLAAELGTMTGIAVDRDGNVYIADRGNKVIRKITVAQTLTAVWPGDANSDGIANNQDVLAIGIAYSFTGAARTNASSNWIGQPCNDWIDTFSNGVNFKHADCNGEGIVDSADVSVISLNYGLTHAKIGSPQGAVDPDIFFVFPQDTFQTGDTVNGTINLGTSAKPVNNIYGIAFSLTYDQTIIDSGSIRVDFTNSWMAPASRVSLAKDVFAASRVDIGHSRSNHQNVSGSGVLADVSFVIQDNIDGKDYFVLPLELQFEDVMAIDKDEAAVNITANGDTLYVEGETVGMESINQKYDVKIFPNPATSEINIVADVGIREYLIFDLAGREILQKISYASDRLTSFAIDVSGLQTGSYFIQLKTVDHYSICRKIVVCR